MAAMKAGLIDRDSLIEELGYDPEEVNRRQAMSMRRVRAYGLSYESDSIAAGGAASETEATRRLMHWSRTRSIATSRPLSFPIARAFSADHGEVLPEQIPVRIRNPVAAEVDGTCRWNTP